MSSTTVERTEIRPFHVDVPEEELADLRRRLAATRWPQRETVADESQGVQLVTMQALVHYWATEYDFRRVEARLNALPQFMTEIDGLDIHFIHVKSPHENALPHIITHPNLIYFNEVDGGNHFAAWQEPDLFTTEVRAAFRSLRDERRSS
jgi:Epoxide hydrolase N terminus